MTATARSFTLAFVLFSSLSSAILQYVVCVYEGPQNACRILAIKREGKRSICRWENSIKMDIKVTG